VAFYLYPFFDEINQFEAAKAINLKQQRQENLVFELG